MTLGEIVLYVDAFNQKMEIERKKQAEVAYTEATLVASFILGGFGGKNPPKIEELFPDIYEATKTEEEKEAERAAAW